MDEIIEYSKKYNIRLVIGLINLFLAFFVLIAGAILYDINQIIAIILLSICLVFFIGGIIIIISSKKFFNEYLKLQKNYIKNKIDSDQSFSSNIFSTTRADKIEFNAEGIIYKDINYLYNDLKILFFKEIVMKAMYSYFIPVIVIGYKNEFNLCIELDNNLINTITNNKISLINQNDYLYFINNFDDGFNQLRKKVIYFNQGSLFTKTEEERNDFKKTRKKSIVVVASILLLMTSFSLLLQWMSLSKEGNNFANLINFSLILNIAVTIIFILLIFVKRKNINLIIQLSIASYIIYHWIYYFFLYYRTGFIIDFFYTILFIFLGIYYGKKRIVNERETFTPTRTVWLATFIAFNTFMNVLNIKMLDEKDFFLGSIIPAIFVVFGCILFSIYYYKKKKEKALDLKKLKQEKIVLFVLNILYPVIIYLICFIYMVGFNYALDLSSSQIYSCEILDKHISSGRNSEFLIKVLINEKEIELSIGSNDYHNLDIGEVIDLSLYKGFFGWEYLIYE